MTSERSEDEDNILSQGSSTDEGSQEKSAAVESAVANAKDEGATDADEAPSPLAELTTDLATEEPKLLKKVRKTRNRKPPGMPRRPLSAYNIFFREERVKWLEELKIMNTNNESIADKSTFHAMGKEIGGRWKKLSKDERLKYEEIAKQDMKRYRDQMKEFNDDVMARTGSSTKGAKSDRTKELSHFTARSENSISSQGNRNAEQLFQNTPEVAGPGGFVGDMQPSQGMMSARHGLQQLHSQQANDSAFVQRMLLSGDETRTLLNAGLNNPQTYTQQQLPQSWADQQSLLLSGPGSTIGYAQSPDISQLLIRLQEQQAQQQALQSMVAPSAGMDSLDRRAQFLSYLDEDYALQQQQAQFNQLSASSQLQGRDNQLFSLLGPGSIGLGGRMTMSNPASSMNRDAIMLGQNMDALFESGRMGRQLMTPSGYSMLPLTNLHNANSQQLQLLLQQRQREEAYGLSTNLNSMDNSSQDAARMVGDNRKG